MCVTAIVLYECCMNRTVLSLAIKLCNVSSRLLFHFAVCSRLCAVFGGVYCLRLSVQNIVVTSNDDTRYTVI